VWDEEVERKDIEKFKEEKRRYSLRKEGCKKKIRK
jgi:hypothetical protein